MRRIRYIVIGLASTAALLATAAVAAWGQPGP